jgi:hypothetical protein
MSKMLKLAGIIGIMILSLVIVTACGSSAPTATPTPAPAPGGGLTLDVTPVMDGKAEQDTSVTATTAPGASCTIKVTNPVTGTVSSYPTDKTKTADASGKVVWTWKIPRQVAKGEGKVEVTATKDGQTATKTVVFKVIESQY